MAENNNRLGQSTKEQLANAIKDLLPTDVLRVNQVGNLSIIRNFEQIGHIELGNTELEILKAEIVESEFIA